MLTSSPPRELADARRTTFDGSYTGAQDRPWIPRLRGDPLPLHPLARSLLEFREQEGAVARERHFRELWKRLPTSASVPLDHERHAPDPAPVAPGLSPQDAAELERKYADELHGCCHGALAPFHARIRWKEFRAYAEAKEAELWHIFHDELDLDGNGHIDAHEFETALKRAGVDLPPTALTDFMTTLTESSHAHMINFREFRDFLLLLPRRASTREIYRYYEVKRSLNPDHRGATRVNMEGDVSLSAEDRPGSSTRPVSPPPASELPLDHEQDMDDDGAHLASEHEPEEHHHWLGGSAAVKFLLAGGVAGAVSRTCTAPFDRLKIFLITRPPDLGGTTVGSGGGVNGAHAIRSAVTRIYAEGGIRGFWVGNALSIAKIFPESAIKFLTYESAKQFFAQYVDGVTDTRTISGSSRFLSGGIAGMVSQLAIYPIETLKTRMMSSTGEQKRTLLEATRHLYQNGGMRGYYRGLTISLIGVFPYAAIDMSTFEALKLAYIKSTGKEDPGVLAMLAFGSVSGSVGATTVYPLNLCRTRLQASGSSGHPVHYNGFRDVVVQTYTRDGWKGFYRGLIPTLSKVVPAVSISYVVYESSKRKLNV